MIHEVEHRLQVIELHPLEVEERVLVRVPPQDISEEGGAGRQDNFVCLNLAVITGESNIKEVLFFPEFSKCDTNVGFKVIPSETEFLR